MLQTLSPTTLSVSLPHWLFAQTCALFNGCGLVVYRSSLVRDTDPIYAPVAEMLRITRVEVLIREMIPDPMMMFGSGEWTLYSFVKSLKPAWAPPIHPSFAAEELSARGIASPN